MSQWAEQTTDPLYAVILDDDPGNVVFYTTDYADALEGLRAVAKDEGIEETRMSVIFRVTVTASTPWVEVDELTNYAHLVDRLIPKGTTITVR